MAQADTSIVPALGGEPQEPLPEAPTPNRRRRMVWIPLAAGFAILLLTYVIAAIAAGSGVPRGTTVLGVGIGGMSKADATETLRSKLPARLPGQIQVTATDEKVDVDSAEAGLAIDFAATVEAAGDSSLNPFTLIKNLATDKSVEPVVTTTGDGMAKVIDEIAKAVEQKPAEGAIDFRDGEAKPVEPKPGQSLDETRMRQALASAYAAGLGVAEAPITVTQPTIGPAEVERAMKELGEPAVSSSVTLKVDGRPVDVPVRTFSKHLSTKPVDGKLTLVVDGRGLRKALDSELEPYEDEAEDATFEIVGGRPRLVPAVEGKEVAPDDLAAAMVTALPKAANRVAEVKLERAEPELTTAEAKNLAITGEISSWTTNFPYAAYRAHNIGKAAEYLNGTLVLPNEEFSFNETVGERTEARGFVKGIIIGGSGSFDADVGGGVSAVATTTFNAIFYAGLRDVEHHPHSFWIPRYPKGTEATVFWGSKDLRFFNDSGHGVFITASATNTSVTITFWGTKKYDITRLEGPERNVKPYDTIERDRCVPQDGMRGFDITTWRVFAQNGQEVRRESFNTHYVPADEIICKEEIHP
jgi:vancomycin resistance protein YoaR